MESGAAAGPVTMMLEGLDVAVDDALAVGNAEARADLIVDSKNIGGGEVAKLFSIICAQKSAWSLHRQMSGDVGQSGAAQERHHVKRATTFIDAHIINFDDILMVELGQDLPFNFKALPDRLAGLFRGEQLKGVLLAKNGVFGDVDHAHAAPTELRNQFVAIANDIAGIVIGAAGCAVVKVHGLAIGADDKGRPTDKLGRVVIRWVGLDQVFPTSQTGYVLIISAILDNLHLFFIWRIDIVIGGGSSCSSS